MRASGGATSGTALSLLPCSSRSARRSSAFTSAGPAWVRRTGRQVRSSSSSPGSTTPPRFSSSVPSSPRLARGVTGSASFRTTPPSPPGRSQMPSAAGESPPNADGTELTLASAGGVEQLTRARGTLFLVTDRHGDIAPRGAKELGLFYEDTRYLSHYELGVVGAAMVYLSAETADDAFNQIDLMLSGLEDKALLDDPQNYLHIRRRQLVEQDFLESIAFTNFLTRKVSLDVRFTFDVDFADVFEVRGARRPRRGRADPPEVGGT